MLRGPNVPVEGKNASEGLSTGRRGRKGTRVAYVCVGGGGGGGVGGALVSNESVLLQLLLLLLRGGGGGTRGAVRGAGGVRRLRGGRTRAPQHSTTITVVVFVRAQSVESARRYTSGDLKVRMVSPSACGGAANTHNERGRRQIRLAPAPPCTELWCTPRHPTHPPTHPRTHPPPRAHGCARWPSRWAARRRPSKLWRCRTRRRRPA